MKKIDYKINKGLPDMFQAVGVDLSDITEQKVSVVKAFTVDEDNNDLATLAAVKQFFLYNDKIHAICGSSILKKDSTTWALLKTFTDGATNFANYGRDVDGFCAGSTEIAWSEDYGANWDEDWWTTVAGGSYLDSSYAHPLKEVRGKLLIGNTNEVATWDGITAAQHALVLPRGYIIKSIERTPYYASILAYGNHESRVFLWDTISESYNYSMSVPDVAQAQIAVGADIYVLTNKGVLYKQAGDVMSPIKIFPDNPAILISAEGMSLNGQEILMALSNANNPSTSRTLTGVWAYNLLTNDLYLKYLTASRALVGTISALFTQQKGTPTIYLGAADTSTGYLNIEKLTSNYLTKGSHIIVPLNNDARKKRLVKLILDVYKTRSGNITLSYSDTTGYNSAISAQTGTSASTFITATDIAEIGDMVMVMSGPSAGDVRFITDKTGTYTYTVDSNFSSALASGNYVSIFKFKKIDTLLSTEAVMSKIMRIGKYIDDFYIRLDITTSGSTTDTAIRNLSAFYNESKN